MDDDAWRIREQPEDEVQLMLARISHVAHRRAPVFSRVPTCAILLGGCHSLYTCDVYERGVKRSS